MPARLTTAMRSEKQYQAWRLHLQGRNMAQIARALGVNRKTVKAFITEGE